MRGQRESMTICPASFGPMVEQLTAITDDAILSTHMIDKVALNSGS